MGHRAVQKEMAERVYTAAQRLTETELRATIQGVTEAINALKIYRKILLKTYHDISTQTITPEVTE